MSNSRAKYEELIEIENTTVVSQNQQGVLTIVEILQASKKAKLRGALLKQVIKISKEAPHLSASVVFQIAADVVKVDELCNKF